jgi:leucyl aminopeptidase (aminopeptidase T)
METAMAEAHRRLRKATSLRLTTPPGTDLTLRVEGREWITDDTGLCRTRGAFATFPAGELLIAPVEGSAEGSLVADVLFHGFVRTPATATVREGYAVRVEGARDAEAAMDAAGHEGRHLSRLGLGFNPKAGLADHSLEARKALGVLHVGFGGNRALGGSVRCDAQVEALAKGVTVEADGRTVLEKGRAV